MTAGTLDYIEFFAGGADTGDRFREKEFASACCHRRGTSRLWVHGIKSLVPLAF